MPSRTLNVTNEAYELLKSHKGPSESFTDVIRRLAGERSLLEVVGVLEPQRAKALEERLSQAKERSRRRRGRQLQRGGA